jgi:hypothetical protein
MPNNFLPVLHTGLVGKFVPANGITPSFQAGIPYHREQLGSGVQLAAWYRRLVIDIPTGQSGFAAYFQITPDMFAQYPTWTNASIADVTGDLDASVPATQISNQYKILGVEARAVITACGTLADNASIDLTVAEDGINPGLRVRLLGVDYSTPSTPSESVPWVGTLACGCTGPQAGSALFQEMDMAEGSNILLVNGSGFTGPCSGTVDIILVTRI